MARIRATQTEQLVMASSPMLEQAPCCGAGQAATHAQHHCAAGGGQHATVLGRTGGCYSLGSLFRPLAPQRKADGSLTTDSPRPLYEYMLLANSLEAAVTVMRFPLLSSYRRHCSTADSVSQDPCLKCMSCWMCGKSANWSWCHHWEGPHYQKSAGMMLCALGQAAPTPAFPDSAARTCSLRRLLPWFPRGRG